MRSLSINAFVPSWDPMAAGNVTAALWLGPAHATRKAVRTYIETTISRCNGCQTCYVCLMSAQDVKQQIVSAPPLVVWLKPKEHGYVREQVDEALVALDVALSEQEQSALVIEAIDQLNHATANRLLKLVEEPPPGWHILLTSDRPADILPTLRSRCIEYALADGGAEASSEGFGAAFQRLSVARAWLEDPKTENWHTVCLYLDELPKTVPEVIRELNHLTVVWHNRWREGSDPRAYALLSILADMADKTPSPGGANGFWRVLCLRIVRALQ